jgi:bifunctional DNA-binding transcriptional regulator/antitoxin component of YhaV-PrlF toxin-antitoxin module
LTIPGLKDIFRNMEIRRTGMGLVKLGKKGQVSIPQGLLRELGLEGDTWLIAEAAENGAIVLRPAAIHPIELYSDERIREFEAEGAITDAEWEQVQKLLKLPAE